MVEISPVSEERTGQGQPGLDRGHLREGRILDPYRSGSIGGHPLSLSQNQPWNLSLGTMLKETWHLLSCVALTC
jgi:hypothetical protein